MARGRRGRYRLLDIVGIVSLYVDRILRTRKARADFELERFQDNSQVLFESEWSIRILHRDRGIERCAVSFGGTPRPLWDKNEPYYQRKIPIGGGANFRIPKKLQEDDAEIVIKDGKKKLEKIKFSELPIGN